MPEPVRKPASPDGPRRRWFEASQTQVSLARWLRLTTPGMLVSRGLVILALLLAPSFTLLVYIDKPVRAVAAALLLAHIMAGLFVVRSSFRRLAIVVAGAMLCVDAVLSGVLLGAGAQANSPSVAIAVLVLAIGFQAGGWRALFVCGLGIGLGVAAVVWFDIGTPLVFSPAASYPTALNVDTSFAGAPALGAAGWVFPTVLDVDTSFAGVSALVPPAYHFITKLGVDSTFAGVPATGWSAPLFVPALVLTCIALCLGTGVTLLRVRRERRRMAQERERTR